MLNVKPSDFNHVVHFGEVGSQMGEDGIERDTFIPKFSAKFSPKSRSMTQQYSILGTELQDSILIVTRHNKSVERGLVAEMPNGRAYNIIDISPDEQNIYITYDIITLKLNGNIKIGD